MHVPAIQIIGRPETSAYIFDDTGLLVDWCGDLGDNPNFEEEKWNRFLKGSPISVDDAKKLVWRVPVNGP